VKDRKRNKMGETCRMRKIRETWKKTERGYSDCSLKETFKHTLLSVCRYSCVWTVSTALCSTCSQCGISNGCNVAGGWNIKQCNGEVRILSNMTKLLK
jgi:hypothetical protein